MTIPKFGKRIDITMQLIIKNIDRITALILVVGCLILVGLKIDSEVKSILTISAGWLFGSTYQIRRVKKN